MAKQNKRTITYTLDQKIKDYNKYLLTDPIKAKELKEYIDFIEFGIKQKK